MLIKYLLIILLTFHLSEGTLFAQTTAWAVGDGEKIFRYRTDHFAEKKNSIWDGKGINLKGVYNEVLGFQVIVELDSLGTEALEVSVAPFLHKKSGKIIGGPDAVKYGDQGYIELYSQHYLNVKRPTEPDWFYGSKNSAPAQMTGWIPDALIPSNAPGKGGFPVIVSKTEAIEFRDEDVLEIIPKPVRQNQGFWVDVHLPRDQNYPAGIYTSEVSVWENSKVISKLPMSLELVNAYLPDNNHSNVWMYTSRDNELQLYFPDLSLDQINKMIKFEAHRHRIELAGGFAVHSSPFNLDKITQYQPYLDGSAFTAENGYHGPGENVGEKLFPVGVYGSQVLGNNKLTIQAESNKWVDWFEKYAPDVRYFWYMIDEPGPVQFPWIRERSQWIKSNPGSGQKMPIHITRSYTEALKDDIDIWNGGHGLDLERFKHLKHQGKEHWFYNGSRPRYGSLILEAEAIDQRVNAWIKYLFDINTWFIWQGTHWRHNRKGPKARLFQRVYNEPLTYINWDFDYGNGDGVMFYPGRMPYQKEEDRGLSLVFPSIRLKNIRRGQQDYELLWLAEQKIGKEQVIELVRTLVPKAMSEVSTEDPVAWSQRGDDYDLIRNKLLDILRK